MATITKRKHCSKTNYLCVVRRKGFKTLVKTFSTRIDSQKLARHIELNLDMGLQADFTEASRAMIVDYKACLLEKGAPPRIIRNFLVNDPGSNPKRLNIRS